MKKFGTFTVTGGAGAILDPGKPDRLVLNVTNGERSQEVAISYPEFLELLLALNVKQLKDLRGCSFKAWETTDAAVAIDELLVEQRHHLVDWRYEPRRLSCKPEQEQQTLIEEIAHSLAKHPEGFDLRMWEKGFVFDMLRAKIAQHHNDDGRFAKYLVKRIPMLNPRIAVAVKSRASEHFSHIPTALIELTLVEGFEWWQYWPNRVWHVALVPDANHPVRVVRG